ncbi:MAG: esterase-like activity of phytase family protein [Acidobacteriota bacterium]
MGRNLTTSASSSIAFLAARCLLLLVVSAATGCAFRGPRATAERPTLGMLRLLGAAAYPAGALTVPGGPPVGDLSGLAFDRVTGTWLGASDDTAQPRLVWMTVTFGPTLAMTPTRFMFLHPTVALPAATMAGLEPESLVALPDGTFATTLEGYHDAVGVVHQPAVMFVNRDGEVTAAAQPPAHFTITAGDWSHGVRHNLGLESLTRTPDGRLISGLEQPLAQDGPMSSLTAGGVVRLLEFVARPSGTWTPGREWAYRLEPTTQVAGYGPPCVDGENGLSEMLALTDDRWLTLERACLLGAPGTPAYNTVRVFEVTTADAEDVSGLPSLAGHSPRLVTKRLVLDVDTLIPRLPPLLVTGSNFEALAFGPPGPAGERTVILMSDDNFRATQTTALLWLALP